METVILGPEHQQAILPPSSPSPAQKTPGPPPLKPRCAAAARRKTLCDITNLGGRRAPAEDEPEDPACADGGLAMAQLVKENAELRRLLEERNAEIQRLQDANWEFAQTHSQMLAELNLGRDRVKRMQHELTVTRAVLEVKTSELEDAKKLLKRRIVHPQEKPANQTGHRLWSDRAAQTKNGDVVDREEPASDMKAASVQKPGNGSRKRMLRSKSLAPGSAAKLALPKEATQRRKSMRIPPPSDRKDDLFELEDVRLAIGGCRIDSESASDSEGPGQGSAQFLRRSSLGRPLRQVREKVATYKEPALNIKLRRS